MLSLKSFIVSWELPVAARISNALSLDPTLFFVIVDCLVLIELPPIVNVTAPSSAFVPLPMCNNESGVLALIFTLLPKVETPAVTLIPPAVTSKPPAFISTPLLAVTTPIAVS